MGKRAPKISTENKTELKKLIKDDKLEEAEEEEARAISEEALPVAISGVAARTPANLLALQRTVGNKAVQRIIKDVIQRNGDGTGGGVATPPKPSTPVAPKAKPKAGLYALPGATYEILEEDGELVAKMWDARGDAWSYLELQEDSGLWKDDVGDLYKLGDGSNTEGEGDKVSLSAVASPRPPNTISGRTIIDFGKKYLDNGTVNLTATLDRIAAGTKLSNAPNDGSIYGNNSEALPVKPYGYWREFVVPTPGTKWPGPQRLVLGRALECYWTGDHYKNFSKIN